MESQAARAVMELIPGAYPDVPESDYFSWPAVSQSRLLPLLKSPAHCKHAMEHPLDPTPAMTLGSAVDCLVLTPHLFNERFAVAEQCSAVTQKKEQCSKQGSFMHCGAWYCGTHAKQFDVVSTPLKDILTPDQSTAAFNIAKSVLNHPTAGALLDSCDEKQLSLVWRENNLLCKGRLDAVSTELQTIFDLKKTNDASPDGFQRSMVNYGYHIQAAMYLRGAVACGMDVKHYCIIAVEEEPPHAVGLYMLSDRLAEKPSAVEYGNSQLLKLLDLYEHCETTGEWPGYSETPVPLGLPGWAEYKLERE